GGLVYGECNFIFAYHGYPHHYFNASIHGMEQVFHQFRSIRLSVAPYQMPSFALQNVIGVYLANFKPQSPSEENFTRILQHALHYPLRRYDRKFLPDSAYKLAAGVYFFGEATKQEQSELIPEVVVERYNASKELQARYPDPANLSLPENLMLWAKSQGAAQ